MRTVCRTVPADADDEDLKAGSPDDAPAEGTGPGSAGSAAS